MNTSYMYVSQYLVSAPLIDEVIQEVNYLALLIQIPGSSRIANI